MHSGNTSAPLAALILAQSDADVAPASQPLLLTLGGQTLLERLAYQAVRLGAGHIILCAGALPGAMVSALDRLKARGLDIGLARSPREAADKLHPDEKVLVLANVVFVQDAELSQLVATDAPTVLTLPEPWGRDRFERIDATDNWTGIANLPASLIRETVAMLGDWAFAPTLIRRAVQQGVVRTPLSLRNEAETDEIAPLVQDDLSGTARAIARHADIAADGAVERLALMPALRPLAAWISLKPVSSTMAAALAILLLIGSVATAALAQPLAAFGLVIGSAIASLLTKLLGQTGVPEPKAMARFLDWRCLALPVILLIGAGFGFSGWKGQWFEAVLGLWAAIQSLVAVHATRRGARFPDWRVGSTGEAVVLLVSYAVGWPSIGLGLVLTHALANQLWAQQKSLNP